MDTSAESTVTPGIASDVNFTQGVPAIATPAETTARRKIYLSTERG
jgi:hypothetical protein